MNSLKDDDDDDEITKLLLQHEKKNSDSAKAAGGLTQGNESDSESSDDMEEIGGFGNTTKPDKVDAMSSGKLTLISSIFDTKPLMRKVTLPADSFGVIGHFTY